MKDESIVFYAAAEYEAIPVIVFSTHNGIRKLIFKQLPPSRLKINPLMLKPDDPLMFNVFDQLSDYFNMKSKEFSVPFDIVGTAFQLNVWSEINKIPFGETKSYKEIGEAIGYKGGFQAIGNAVGANPLPIIIPCHRVLGHTGQLTGYSGGLHIKKKLLEIEGKLTPELF
ncbi:MAG: methylated-DNA--[protein]-cysteine S-methyltransferase [Bacteroidota bacterium]|nr:methylated-DNA--[protein]-cysteine S-methyltransferase [Bacteroidota bacterium]